MTEPETQRVPEAAVDIAEDAIELVGPDRHLRDYAKAAVQAAYPAILSDLRSRLEALPRYAIPNMGAWLEPEEVFAALDTLEEEKG
jgi:hypothetical protein